MRRLLTLAVLAAAATIAWAVTAQAYVPVPHTNCILRATAPISILGNDDASVPWSGDGEVDCDTQHNVALNVILWQYVTYGWQPIFFTSNSWNGKVERKNIHSNSIPYLTVGRWYCTKDSVTVDQRYAVNYKSQSIMVDKSGAEHFGTC